MKGQEGIKAQNEGVTQRRASGRSTFFLPYLLFLALCFVYLWLVVEPRLIYYCFGTILPGTPLFATGGSFLRQSLGEPSGLATYIAGFLSTGFYHSWLGAAIIILAGACLVELSRRHLKAAGLAHASTAATLPAIALFLSYSHYKHPLTISLVVSTGLLASLVFEKLPLHRRPARLVVFCILATALFWLAGVGALLVFGALTAIYATFARRDWIMAALVIPAGAAAAWVLTQYLFLIPARQAFLTPLTPSQATGINGIPRILTFFLYVFMPAAVLLVFIGKHLLGKRGQKVSAPKPKGRHKHAVVERRNPILASVRRPVLVILPIAAIALGLYLTSDPFRKPYVLSNSYWQRKQWDKILDLAGRLPGTRTNIFVNHDILRALYHTGRLPYDMFRFPLIPEAILLTHEKGLSDLTLLKLSDIYLELGYVNMAQKMASELAATKDHLGTAIEELGWINIIKGCPATARVYLENLRQDPVRRHTADSLLHALDNGFTPDQAAYIARIRSYSCDQGPAVTGEEPVDQVLAALVQHNPNNRMAFEYLMACYLLTGKVDKISENIPRLRDLGYQRIPTLYEEAILIHGAPDGQKADLAGFAISRDTIDRYNRFVQIASLMPTLGRQAVLNRLIQEFGTSYFFYFFSRTGPK